ncbi:hypothetical protein [Pseudomonas putida]
MSDLIAIMLWCRALNDVMCINCIPFLLAWFLAQLQLRDLGGTIMDTLSR